MTDEPLAEPPAIHRWPDVTWADNYEAQVRKAGWQAVQLDTRMRWDKAGFLAACRSTFGFADWFGMNWDALADSLSDVPVSADTGLLVQWRGWGGMARMYPGDFAVACDVLAEFVTRRAARGETVLLALVGEGPQL